jgi:hypothetical protein
MNNASKRIKWEYFFGDSNDRVFITQYTTHLSSLISLSCVLAGLLSNWKKGYIVESKGNGLFAYIAVHILSLLSVS